MAWISLRDMPEVVSIDTCFVECTTISCMQTAQVHLVKPKEHGVQTIKKELLEVGSLIMKQIVRNILISTFILLLNFLPSPGALTQVQQDLCQFVDNNVIGC